MHFQELFQDILDEDSVSPDIQGFALAILAICICQTAYKAT